MPITKSAKKSLKVSESKRKLNHLREVRLEKAMRTASKENISSVISIIDKAAKTNLIHKNKANRMKSKLTKEFGAPAKKEAKVQKPKATTSTVKAKVKKTVAKTKSK